ncbi:hypothetical protein Cni_G03636 [Canna indica]|uniref:Uncharacterized protein n=1 Tax=Canna indica TaxID=4628 RepID=A0AAQ3JU95_9LILI|nr:hypothetical protein Cni_G03636 [Canna indica]
MTTPLELASAASVSPSPSSARVRWSAATACGPSWSASSRLSLRVAHRICRVHGSPNHHPHHRHQYQPCSQPWIGAAMIYNKDHAWDDHWFFWAGSFIGVALAAMYHQIVIRAIPLKRRSEMIGQCITSFYFCNLADRNREIT